MRKEIENFEFMCGVNFEFIDSLKNHGTKYLLLLDDSCEESCNSKAFVDIVTAGRHPGLSRIYIKHNLFHQSKLGRDVELQNTHIVLFKSARDVIQVTTLSTQMGLGSELFDWYSLKNEIKKNLFSKADSLVDRILLCQRIELSKSQTSILNGVATGISVVDFAQQLRRKNADISEFYITLPDVAGISTTLILNQNVKAKERRSWVPFKIWMPEAAKAVHTGWCCLWICAQLSES